MTSCQKQEAWRGLNNTEQLCGVRLYHCSELFSRMMHRRVAAMLQTVLYPPLTYGEKTTTIFSFWGWTYPPTKPLLLQDFKSATCANVAAVTLSLMRWNHKTSCLYAQTLWQWIPSSLPAQGWTGSSPGYSLAQTMALLLGPTELWASRESASITVGASMIASPANLSGPAPSETLRLQSRRWSSGAGSEAVSGAMLTDGSCHSCSERRVRQGVRVSKARGEATLMASAFSLVDDAGIQFKGRAAEVHQLARRESSLACPIAS